MTLGERLSYEEGFGDGIEMGILISVITAFFIAALFFNLS